MTSSFLSPLRGILQLAEAGRKMRKSDVVFTRYNRTFWFACTRRLQGTNEHALMEWFCTISRWGEESEERKFLRKACHYIPFISCFFVYYRAIEKPA